MLILQLNGLKAVQKEADILLILFGLIDVIVGDNQTFTCQLNLECPTESKY
jgi:hypothetical protein